MLATYFQDVLFSKFCELVSNEEWLYMVAFDGNK